MESYNETLKNEILNLNYFETLEFAKQIIEECSVEYK